MKTHLEDVSSSQSASDMRSQINPWQQQQQQQNNNNGSNHNNHQHILSRRWLEMSRGCQIEEQCELALLCSERHLLRGFATTVAYIRNGDLSSAHF
jgi:hypothetical protein